MEPGLYKYWYQHWYIASYWHAKPITMFSRNDVRVYSIFDDAIRPYYHATNENWFHAGGKGKYADPVFNYIYADGSHYSSELLVDEFGDRLDTIYARNDAAVIKLPEFIFERTTRKIILLDHSLEE